MTSRDVVASNEESFLSHQFQNGACNETYDLFSEDRR